MSIAERYSRKATQFSRRWRWIHLGLIASGILIFSYRAGNHSNLVYQNHEIDYWIRELYSDIENPFLIGVPKAFPQRSLPPSTRVPTPSPIGEP